MLDQELDVEKVVSAAHAVPVADYPGGWPDEIEAALIDAVLSIQAVYGAPDTGVRASIESYRVSQNRTQPDDLTILAGQDPETLKQVLHNGQRSAGKLKAAAIVEAAANLAHAGVTRAAQLDSKSRTQQNAYTSVRGLGDITWAYFGMNLGRPGVKADTWIIRFVAQALARKVSADEAGHLVIAAATRLGVDPIKLDFAIWDHTRRAASSRPPAA